MEKNQNDTHFNSFQKFCNNTSIHGFGFLIRKRTKKSWIFLITVSVYFCCYQCNANIVSYLRHDVKIEQSFDYSANTGFPAITLCAQYQYKRSVFLNMAVGAGVIANYYARTYEELVQLSKQVS